QTILCARWASGASTTLLRPGFALSRHFALFLFRPHGLARRFHIFRPSKLAWHLFYQTALELLAQITFHARHYPPLFAGNQGYCYTLFPALPPSAANTVSIFIPTAWHIKVHHQI